MDSCTVAKAARATLDGSMAFALIVGNLIEAGVEYYHVDYVTLQTTFYSGIGEALVTPLVYEGLPAIGEALDVQALRAAILDSQQNDQPYRKFTQRAMLAGVQGYFAFLRGKRVTYLGRNGDQHVEWFAGAKTSDS
jgi:uncharacterized protein YbcV (DUF1398 family)